MKQIHLFYSGRVQGVGFRYTTQNFAHKLALKGWVKNLPDGRVEMVVQGLEKDIYQLQSNLKEHFGDYISDIIQETQVVLTPFNDFRIK